MKRKPIPNKTAAPECSVCTTPNRCGTRSWRERKGPRCAGKADGPDDCDCLNACGDDPWLKEGKSLPCARLVAARAEEARQASALQQLRKFLDAAAGEGLELAGVDAAELFNSLYGQQEVQRAEQQPI